MIETPRTDAMLSFNDDDFIIALCRDLELENRDLRNLLDEASRVISRFVDLQTLAATELKSAHNGICIFLSATKMLNEIKACAGNEEQGE